MPRYRALAPFRIRSYRFQWPADLLTSWAFEMETLILGWYILVETGSVFLLTVFGALQFVGTLIAPMVGVASDRIGHRDLLAIMRTAYAACAVALMAVAFAGALTPAVVFIVSAVSGFVRPSDLGLRNALIAETMPPKDLISATGVSRTTSDSARIAGALAGAGAFEVFGMALSYVVISSFYILSVASTLGIAAPSKAATANEAAMGNGRTSPWYDLREGLLHVWTRPKLLGAIWLAFLVNLTAFPFSNGLLPYVAKDVYGTDQSGLGYLIASFAGGALIASIVLSRTTFGLSLPRLMLVAAACWYVMLPIFGHMQSIGLGAACLLVAGFAQSLSLVTLSVILLRGSEARFRGRVMGVRMLAIYSLPLGLLAAGALIAEIGFAATTTLYALAGLTLTIATAVYWRADQWHAVDEAL
jgi:predicted MFS family arabinose efflux permease